MPTQTSPFKVVIVGAGLAGLTAAIALRGANREIVVLEQSSLKREIGAAINVNPNATLLFHKWGLDVEKAAQGAVCAEIVEIGADNSVRHQVRIDTKGLYGAPWLLHHRVDLHNALREFAVAEGRTGDPARVIVGAKVVAVDCEAGVVTTEGGDTYTADLIIGSDGIHSAVRKAVLGPGNVAEPSGHSAYRCLIPIEKLQHIPEAMDMMPLEDSKMKIVVNDHRRVVMYPCRHGAVLNIVAICPQSFMQETSEQSWNAEGSVDKMLATFAGFPDWLLETLRQAVSPGVWQLRDQEPLSHWVKGRAIIIGDAAHAMLPHQGQGAGQGIEDAEAIGAFFESIHGAVDAPTVNRLLMEVFQARYERASTIQAYSRKQAKPLEGTASLNPSQFFAYNMSYKGVRDWIERQRA